MIGLDVKIIKHRSNSEKVARPILLSLTIYFTCIIVANVFLFFYNLETQFFQPDLIRNADPVITVMAFYALIILNIGPRDLMYQIEKNSLKKPIYTKKHILTIIQCILIALIFYNIFTVRLIFPDITIEVIGQGVFGLFSLILTIDVFFFLVTFFYLASEAPKGPYKKDLRLIAIGYLLTFLGSGATTMIPSVMGRLFVFFFLSIIGAFLMSYGFIKLYSLTQE